MRKDDILTFNVLLQILGRNWYSSDMSTSFNVETMHPTPMHMKPMRVMMYCGKTMMIMTQMRVMMCYKKIACKL